MSEPTAAPHPDLSDNIKKIAAYTARHPELRSAHHFLYDLRVPPAGRPKFVVMGINPGESANDWQLSATPTEETSRHDFHHVAEKTGSARRWANLANYYLDGADHVLAEVFFWSSRNMRQFEERFGSLSASPHLSFCRDMNLDLLNAYTPQAVILPGIGVASICAAMFDLRQVSTVRDGPARLVEIYTDSVRPWLFTKHWTGARGLTSAQKSQIREAIRQHSSVASCDHRPNRLGKFANGGLP